MVHKLLVKSDFIMPDVGEPKVFSIYKVLCDSIIGEDELAGMDWEVVNCPKCWTLKRK